MRSSIPILSKRVRKVMGVVGTRATCTVFAPWVPAATGLSPEASALTKQRAPTPDLVDPCTRGRASQCPPVQLLANGPHSLLPQPCRKRRKLLPKGGKVLSTPSSCHRWETGLEKEVT